MSVSLAVTQGNPNNPAAPNAKAYWEKTFGSFRKEEAGEQGEKKEKGEGRGREESEKGTPPKKIEGVGEEAFWSGNRFGGALYVLKKEMILRLSVGGPDNEETKINKSKALAQKAIERL
jgi:hypothetical protein